MPLDSIDIRGTWATVLLPINEDDSIDWDRLQDEIDVLTESGISGIYTNGTAGEFYTQTADEFNRISEMTALACTTAGIPFQLGASHPCPQESLERLRRAKQFEPCAIQVILPDWSPVNMNEVISFLERMASEAAPVPLVVYNPPHAKRVLSPKEWGQVVQAVPAVVGIKVVGGDEAWHEQMKQHAPDLSIFVAGHNLASGIQRGAHGSYSNMACMNPVAAVAWWKLMHEDMSAALDLEERMGEFNRTSISPLIGPDGFSNQAADKLLAAIGGWGNVGTRLRWPYSGFEHAEVIRLRSAARAVIPEFISKEDGD